MFTGLIERVGEVVELRRSGAGARLVVSSDLPVREIEDGESIAVDGVCLTVAKTRGRSFEADVIAETLSRTTLGTARPGRRVNLERSLRLSDRLGGHLVQGHVDGVARIVSVDRRPGDHRVRLEAPRDLRRYLAEKGSVALQGVSLTVAAVRGAAFEVALIPETVARTNLGDLRAGSRVHVEVDLVARYLESLSRGPRGRPGGPR